MGEAEATRVLVVMPSWVGDAIMATPALRLLRDVRPGALVGLLVRPGIESLLEGTGLYDEAHVDRGAGVMAPKAAAAKIRGRRYEAAVLLKNSFSSALAVRMGGVPRRVGYARDARGLLLTSTLPPPMRADGEWAIVPAVEYYLRLMRHFLEEGDAGGASAGRREGIAQRPVRLEMVVTPEQDASAAEVLARAGVDPLGRTPLALLNPGGNNPAKRWPVERFGAVADFLHDEHGMTVLVNGSPGERDVVGGVVSACKRARAVDLAGAGVTLPALKGIVARCGLMVTNDTGPRHVAVALGVPVVTLFGPTDHRWTTVPSVPMADGSSSEEIVLADPTLPEAESANDHPERCRIERIGVATVVAACARLLAARSRVVS